MYERITVPLDGSEDSEGAMLWAGQLARRFNSEVVLLTVVDTPQLNDGDWLIRRMERTDIALLGRGAVMFPGRSCTRPKSTTAT